MTRFPLPVPHLGFGNLRGDLFGGITAGIVALPLALAFGVASGAGPVAGLYGAICVGLFASLFGGTPSQISGPTGPMTIVSATVFTHFAGEPAVAFTVVMLAGLFQVGFGMLRLGRFVNLMPYPVVSGFITGVGVILIVMQLDPLLGYGTPASVINAFSVLPRDLLAPNWQSVALGLLALGVVLLPTTRHTRLVPAPLLALAVCMLAAVFLPGAPRLGEIPSGLPSWNWPTLDLAQINEMLVFAAVLAALGAIDSLLTSLVADNVTRTFHDSDRELVGQGIGNLVAGLAGGIPGAGATIRTLTNVQAGGRTSLSGVIHAILLLVVTLGLGRYVGVIPMAALAGILVKVGLDVIDWRFLRRLHRAPRTDLVLFAVVLALTVLVNVITAVAVGVVLASLVMVKELAELQVESIRTVSHPEQEHLFDPATAQRYREHREDLLYLHLSGMMSFGAATELARRFGVVGDYRVLLIDLLDVPRMDTSAALALESIIVQAAEQQHHVILVGMSYPVARLLTRLGAIDRIRESERFENRAAAVAAAVAWLDRHPDIAT
jgi:SulP family sulfate permease